MSGEGTDPMNDEHVKVGFYVSNDKMVKDGNGNIAPRLYIPHRAACEV